MKFSIQKPLDNKSVQPNPESDVISEQYEKEADLMADKVMAMAKPPPPIQRKCDGCEEEELQMKPLSASITPIVQKQPIEEEEDLLQMQPLEEEEELLQPKLIQRQPTGEEEKLLQPKLNGNVTSNRSNLSSKLTRSKGSGSHLPESTHQFMGNAFGSDFSQVKIHTDQSSIQMNRQLGARAFTNGNDIYFNEGEYNPSSNEGKHLLAHELTHTIQQNSDVTSMRNSQNDLSLANLSMVQRRVERSNGRPILREDPFIVPDDFRSFRQGLINFIHPYVSSGRDARLVDAAGGDHLWDYVNSRRGSTIDLRVDFVWSQSRIERINFSLPGLEAASIPEESDESYRSEFDLEAPSEEQERFNRERGIQLPSVSEGANPEFHSDYVERRAIGVTWPGFLLGGFFVHVSGVDLPIFVELSHLDWNLTSGERIDSRIYSTRSVALQRLAQGASRQGTNHFAFYRGAGGRLVSPTVFSPRTTPKICEALQSAVQQAAGQVVEELTGIAILIATGIVIRVAISGIGVLLRNRQGRTIPAPVQRIQPVNEHINVGGGFETPNASNLNPMLENTGGPSRNVPNLVRGFFRQIAEFFEANSARFIESNRLPYHTVSWEASARGSFRVLRSGGTIRLNVWTRSQAEVDALIEIFTNAGFQNVRNIGGVGPGTTITGIKP